VAAAANLTEAELRLARTEEVSGRPLNARVTAAGCLAVSGFTDMSMNCTAIKPRWSGRHDW